MASVCSYHPKLYDQVFSAPIFRFLDIFQIINLEYLEQYFDFVIQQVYLKIENTK